MLPTIRSLSILEDVDTTAFASLLFRAPLLTALALLASSSSSSYHSTLLIVQLVELCYQVVYVSLRNNDVR